MFLLHPWINAMMGNPFVLFDLLVLVKVKNGHVMSFRPPWQIDVLSEETLAYSDWSPIKNSHTGFDEKFRSPQGSNFSNAPHPVT